MQANCPTCGSRVAIQVGGEGTCSYRPLARTEALEAVLEARHLAQERGQRIEPTKVRLALALLAAESGREVG